MGKPRAFNNALERERRNGDIFNKIYVYEEDFDQGGYAKDLALTNESNPSGKFSTTANMSPWLVTLIDGDSDAAEIIVISDDENGGVLTITANDKDNDAISMQINGEAVKPLAGRKIVYRAKLKIADISETDWAFGLASSDTDILGGASSAVMFRCPDSTGDIDTVTEKATSETTADSGVNVVDDTFQDFVIVINGVTSVSYYIDNVHIVTDITNIPVVSMSPFLEVRNDGAVAQTMEVDLVRVSADR